MSDPDAGGFLARQPAAVDSAFSVLEAVAELGPGVTGRVDFAQNKLAIVVPAGNPAGIENLDDLTEDDVQLVLAAEGVPVGDYAREVLANAGISEAALANVVSNEEDVKAVITKVKNRIGGKFIHFRNDTKDKVCGPTVDSPLAR